MKNKPRILFRADASSTIGMGHVVRSMALAEMLKHNFECVFVTRLLLPSLKSFFENTDFKIVYLPLEEDHFVNFCTILESNDIVVLDNYFFDSDYQLKLKSKIKSLVCIDDLHNKHFYADIVINHAQGVCKGDYSKEEYTKLCLGFDYALLRPEFLQPVNRTISTTKNRVLIAFGGLDVYGLNNRFARWIIEHNDVLGINDIHILGAENSHLMEFASLKSVNINFHSGLSAKKLIELFDEVDFGIFSASTIAIEACSMYLPIITGYYVDNQLGILRGFEDLNLGLSLGDFCKLSCEDFINYLHPYLNSDLSEVSTNMIKTFDKKSSNRILDLFLKYEKKK